jgi:hypothetical protein
MGLPLFREKRFSKRLELTGLLPGRLIMKETNTNLSAKPVDVSENGLGIVINFQVRIGAQMTLQRGDEIFDLEVSWVQPDFGKNDLYRCGLICKTPGANLIEVFRDSGCLKES